MAAADITLDKTLPRNIDSEKAVLGAIILDDKAIFTASEVLTVEDFYLEAHRENFKAMLSLFQHCIDEKPERRYKSDRHGRDEPYEEWHSTSLRPL